MSSQEGTYNRLVSGKEVADSCGSRWLACWAAIAKWKGEVGEVVAASWPGKVQQEVFVLVHWYESSESTLTGMPVIHCIIVQHMVLIFTI